MIEARIIGESSAGLTALEIWDGKKLVWSHDYFANGATQDDYDAGLRQIVDDAMACEDYRDFEGNDEQQYETGDTSYVLLRYTKKIGWILEIEHPRGSQDCDLLLANKDRLPLSDEVLGWISE